MVEINQVLARNSQSGFVSEFDRVGRPASENLDFGIASQSETIQMHLFTNAGWWKPMLGGGNQLWVNFPPAEFGTLSRVAQQPEGLQTNAVYRLIQREKLV